MKSCSFITGNTNLNFNDIQLFTAWRAMVENLKGASLAEVLGTQVLLQIVVENQNWYNLHQEQLGKNQSKL